MAGDSGTYPGLDFGIAFGGNDLLTPDVTGTNPGSHPHSPGASLPAGDALFLDLHLRQEIFHTGFALQAAVGYAYTCDLIFCLGSTPANFAFQRFNEDLLGSYDWDHDGVTNRVSVGRTWHNWNQLTSSSGDYPFPDVHLMPARGWVLEYQLGPVGLRYTNIIYRNRVSPTRVNSSNGSSLGLFISLDPEDWYGAD